MCRVILMATAVLGAGISLAFGEDALLATDGEPLLVAASRPDRERPGAVTVASLRSGTDEPERRRGDGQRRDGEARLLPGRFEIGLGSRVRVSSSALPERSAGYVRALDDVSLTVALDGDEHPVRLDRSSIERLEVSLGRRRGSPRLVALGAAGCVGIGGGVFVLLEAANDWGPLGNPGAEPGDFGDPNVRGIIRAVAIFAVVGAVIGAASHEEVWHAVDLPRIRAAVGPGRHGGVVASLSLRF